MRGRTNAGNGGLSGIRIVSGNTAPEKPKDGTIWVCSDISLKKFAIVSRESLALLEDESAYIEVSSEADSKIGNLELSTKNIALRMALRTAKLCYEKEWVNAAAYMYSSGVWTRISRGKSIYDNGVNTAVLKARLENSNVSNIKFNKTEITLTTATGKTAKMSLVTDQPIDVTYICKLYCEILLTGPDNGVVFGIYQDAISDSKGKYPIGAIKTVVIRKNDEKQKAELDIRGLSGRCYVGLVLDGAKGSITEVYGE